MRRPFLAVVALALVSCAANDVRSGVPDGSINADPNCNVTCLRRFDGGCEWHPATCCDDASPAECAAGFTLSPDAGIEGCALLERFCQ